MESFTAEKSSYFCLQVKESRGNIWYEHVYWNIIDHCCAKVSSHLYSSFETKTSKDVLLKICYGSFQMDLNMDFLVISLQKAACNT